ncbi:zinc finger TRAF-type-containing protein 1 homolog isoform X2 [Neocloeon triangulifer]|uniref:zinc finger TRAF-type-containing protein 1 homolog isoform X2 n=1 Tax=Neocloeon triangulifer TaxID=2078957 RepID=UPI00286F441C|nr:zinc finger TRAF-type-containing protein 1 homolog isoform X2 [Neocloeon triangulifer]
MAEVESPSSSAGLAEALTEQENAEPAAKKPKIEPEKGNEKLEHRLGGILCCAVCLDLPRSAVYQCSNGHLLCAGCFTHVLADARLRDEVASCPSCRVELSRASACRNLAVEKAVSELPAPCTFCGKEFARAVLQRHQDELCDERITECQFRRLGCPWCGPHHEAVSHAAECPHPNRSGRDLMPLLETLDSKAEAQEAIFNQLVSLLSFEKITFNDLQMKPYRTDEFVHKLFYESARFTAFNNQWVVKAFINTKNQRDPTQCSERDMNYQVVLKSKSTPSPLTVHYMVLSGPFGDLKVNPQTYVAEFSDQSCEGPVVSLPIPDTNECNRLLASKTFSLRLIMFLVSK